MKNNCCIQLRVKCNTAVHSCGKRAILSVLCARKQNGICYIISNGIKQQMEWLKSSTQKTNLQNFLTQKMRYMTVIGPIAFVSQHVSLLKVDMFLQDMIFVCYNDQLSYKSTF